MDHVSKHYTDKNSSVDALIDVSVRVEPGDLFGITGVFGAGKSTLIRMITGAGLMLRREKAVMRLLGVTACSISIANPPDLW